ncbi:hypothetical protein RB3375 [Rhodopirellula baltica SH 1]|uniref:Uncharacterized protein n=1 Tax=Rhodopirellula baltica (strain DSM 10527 / NCIMB 13988 / SH1) TaxID=243090 RepID=Q7UUC3_RHOBA|nr:hypothetical protein RB3375 [Rhodopirellula baltica SH 1]
MRRTHKQFGSRSRSAQKTQMGSMPDSMRYRNQTDNLPQSSTL